MVTTTQNCFSLETAHEYQEQALQGVSRTFALTIPQLPPSLRLIVGNAYLLCRVLDTIEDDIDLNLKQKEFYGDELIKVIDGNSDAKKIAAEITPLLSSHTSKAERDLMQHLPIVIQIKRSFTEVQQHAIERCARIMWYGMRYFLRRAGLAGLDTESELDAYCYYGAGVVGELLTDLFCNYSPEIEAKRNAMYQLSSSFGKGLQLTNILKDQWEDRQRGISWLPRDLFLNHGVDLRQSVHYTIFFGTAQTELLGLAHLHMRNALLFTLLIPPKEIGIRKFCYLTLSLAAMTLDNIHRKPNFKDGQEVKIPRWKIAATFAMSSTVYRNNKILKGLFNIHTRRLPLGQLKVDLREASDYPTALG